MMSRYFRHAAHERLSGAAGVRRVAWLSLPGALLCAQVVLGLGCESVEQSAVSPKAGRNALSEFSVKSDAEKQALALTVLTRFVPHAERYWRESDLSEPYTGWYAATGPGVTQPRGAGNIAFAYVTLLRAYPKQASFGGVPRETLVDHVIQSIRHEAYTNALSGAGYNRWGNGTWQASLETYPWAFAAYLLWDALDEETRTLVRRVVTGEATILIDKPIASGEEGDTGAEDNAWNAPTPALSAVMFPDDAHADAWRETAIRLALNASSTAADAASDAVVDGRMLGEWMASVNLHPDLSMENHGFFNPIYQQVTHVNIGDAAIIYGAANAPLPDAFSFRTETIWEEILMRLAADDGDLIMTAGQDWISKDYQHLCYLGILSTRFQRTDASVLESRALELVAARQAAHESGAVLGQSELGYESMLIKRLAALWWHHHLFGPSPSPSAEAFASAREAANGVTAYPYSDFIAARLGQAFVSMSWDGARPMGLVVPHGEAYLEDPVFSYYAPNNLIGAAGGAIGAHTCDCEADRFSTAGSLGARRFSMTAFEDGTAILLDQGEGATFTYALERIDGLTGERPIWSEEGEGLGSLSGAWVNAADRLGMIVRGGAGIFAEVQTGDNDQIVITGSTDTGSGHRGALLLPLSDHDTTAELAPSVTQPVTPDDWSALSGQAADRSVRLAVARFGGPSVAGMTLSDERGAPVVEEYGTLSGTVSKFDVRLAPTSSHGQTVRFLVQADAPLKGQQEGDDRILLRNPNPQPIETTVTYLSEEGERHVESRPLFGGEEVRARLVGGVLMIAGPELDPLVAARAVLTGLVDALEAEQADRLTAIARNAVTAVETAIARARSGGFRTRQAVGQALRAIDALVRIARLPYIPQPLGEAVLQAADQAEGSLEAALESIESVSLWIEPVGRVQPGEPAVFRMVLRNRGHRPVRGGSVTLNGPEGWSASVSVTAFERLAPGASTTIEVTLPTPIDAIPFDTARLVAELTYQVGPRPRIQAAEVTVPVDPVIEIAPVASRIPLADGSINAARFVMTSHVDSPLHVTLDADAPDGAVAALAASELTLDALETVEVEVTLAGVERTGGTALLTLSAVTDAGAEVTADAEIHFTDNLALNPWGAPWPQISASSFQESYSPALAVDGDDDTFWVSGGTVSGEGPSPENPETLTVDFGGAVDIGAVIMVPRTGYGPATYTIEISDDGAAWQEIADVPSAANATVTTTFPPVTARFLRLRITGSWDWVQPPRNVQIRSLIVHPPSDDLALNPWGAPWPQALADSAQSGYPATNAFDGDDGTFWVSAGTAAGEGPSPTHPETLGVDFGSAYLIGSVTVVPRAGYGPAAYTIEISDDGEAWQQIAEAPEAPNATITTTFPPVTTRMVRLLITDSWDWVEPPRNVQIRTMMVKAPQLFGG